MNNIKQHITGFILGALFVSFILLSYYTYQANAKANMIIEFIKDSVRNSNNQPQDVVNAGLIPTK